MKSWAQNLGEVCARGGGARAVLSSLVAWHGPTPTHPVVPQHDGGDRCGLFSIANRRTEQKQRAKQGACAVAALARRSGTIR